jgi:hypothetical protein
MDFIIFKCFAAHIASNTHTDEELGYLMLSMHMTASHLGEGRRETESFTIFKPHTVDAVGVPRVVRQRRQKTSAGSHQPLSTAAEGVQTGELMMFLQLP